MNENEKIQISSNENEGVIVKQLSKDEISLLLYLETCLVDQNGRVSSKHMNTDDKEIAKKWNDEGFIKYGRIKMADIYLGSDRVHYVNFTDEAWKLAHQYRKIRGEKNKYKVS